MSMSYLQGPGRVGNVRAAIRKPRAPKCRVREARWVVGGGGAQRPEDGGSHGGSPLVGLYVGGETNTRVGLGGV
eukprot:5969212-Prymnesium_polylepis.1